MIKKLLSNSERIPVRVQILSEVLRRERIERVDYLKVDVEGAEMDVIGGIEDQHWPVISQIAMEVAPANKRQLPLLTSRLHSLGFGQVTLESALE